MKHLTSSEGTSHPCLTPFPNPKQQPLKLSLPNSVRPVKVKSKSKRLFSQGNRSQKTNTVQLARFLISLCSQSLHCPRHTSNCSGSLSDVWGGRWCPSGGGTSLHPSQSWEGRAAGRFCSRLFSRARMLLLTHGCEGKPVSASRFTSSATQRILVFNLFLVYRTLK